MSGAFQERLGQEKESTGRISQIPCPSSLLVAASTLKYIMDAADVERNQREYMLAEGGHERGGGIDCRLTTGGAACCGQEEKQQCRELYSVPWRTAAISSAFVTRAPQESDTVAAEARVTARSIAKAWQAIQKASEGCFVQRNLL